MRNRLALVSITALTAVGALAGSASAAMWNAPPSSGAPGAQCAKADLACRAPSGVAPSATAAGAHGSGQVAR
jgi:hypothetical protein